jgi:hypothetical protein
MPELLKNPVVLGLLILAAYLCRDSLSAFVGRVFQGSMAMVPPAQPQGVAVEVKANPEAVAKAQEVAALMAINEATNKAMADKLKEVK